MYRRVRYLKCWVFFYMLWLSLFYLSVSLWRFAQTPFITQKNLIFHIQPKTTAYHLIANLIDAGILKHPRLFLILAHFKNALNNLQAGEYELERGLTPNECLNKFKKGKVKLYRFTVVEGWTYHQLVKFLQKDKRFKNIFDESFLNSLRSELPFSVISLEGLFFAESYDFPRNTPNIDILRKALRLMQSQLLNAWEKREPNLPWKDPYEALIAASLVEKETALSDERPKIAGVIIRRLQKGMPLQIDASIIYGLKKRYNSPLNKRHLKYDTPYNTYTRKGLPPTPIAIPSLNSIQAVLKPDLKRPYLYFVAKKEGRHHFSENLRDHQLAVKRYRKRADLKTN